MKRSVVLLAVALVAVALAGCFGSAEEDPFDYRPGEGFKPTGRTVHLKATVLDLTDKEIYPGLEANMWAFCFKPADPDDAYSAAVIEYAPDQEVDVASSAWKGACSTPGPTLRIQQGDKVIVDFVNEHVHPHTIHWHGQYVPFGSDGVPGSTQDSVVPGQSFRYEFIASRAGTLWYHCHVDTQFHVMQGLYGVMIVEPQDQRWEPAADRDQVITFSTMRRDLVEATPARKEDPHAEHKNLGSCGVTGEQGCQNPPVDVTPDTFMLNGVSFPNTLERNDTLIRLKPGENLRLRLLNAGTTIEAFHTHGHDMLVTHIDGNPLPPNARYYVDTVTIVPAQRIDVLLEGRENNAGVWVAHTHVNDHETNDGQGPGGMHTAIVYPGYEDQVHAFKAELPGGRGYIPPITLPEDLDARTTRELATETEVAEEWSFPVELSCAVRSIRFDVDVDPSSSSLQSLNDLSLSIQDPEGEEVALLRLGATRSGNWTYDRHTDDVHLPEGDYQVALTGRAVDSVAKMTVLVDYFDDLDELAADGDPCTGGEGEDGEADH